MDQASYNFRQPESLNELRALLELRYRVYRESRLSNLATENTLALDLDCYDLNAMHFGLFRYEHGIEQPVGCMRLVTDSPQSFAYDITTIASEDGIVLHRVLQTPEVPFPVMTYAPAADRVDQLHHELQRKGERIVEPGRFSLDESARGRLIATFMVASTFTVTIANGIDSAILSCAVQHGWMYKHFGFSLFPGTSEFQFERVGQAFLLLICVRAGLSESERERVMKMVDVYKETGRICYNPAQPENFYAPAEKPVEVMSAAA